MKINISHQKPDGINHADVERWQRHLKRSKKMTTQLEKISKRLEIARILIVILLVIFIVLLSEQSPYLGSLGKWGIIIVLASIFIYLLYAHQKINKRRKFLYYFSDYYKGAINRRTRQWEKINIPKDKPNNDFQDHAVKDVFNDLAITGDQASLDKLFSMMHCSDAWEKWFNWLSSPSTDSTIKKRQQAVKELMFFITFSACFITI